jgi:hypothetical protein
VKRIDFYKLSREKQERFIASTKGDAPPAPIVQNTETGGVTVRWAVLSAVGILALLVLYVVQFGVLGAHFALHPVEFLLLYAVLLFSIPYAALRAVANWRGPKVLPYKPGIYVFPMCLVDARRKTLGIFAMTDIGSVGKASAGGALKLSFRGGGAFAFPAQDAHDAEMLNRGIDNAQEQVKHALATSDDSELTTLDPFYEGRKSWTSPIGPKDALRDRAPSWSRLDWAIGAACALVLSPILWMAHNRSSDNAMFAKAAAQGSPEAYQAYLSHGRAHNQEVASTLLPRAELARAKKVQTVESIQAFIGEHPNSAIDAEAQAALREAMLRELEKANAGASLASLAAFEAQYPNHHLGPELAAARHDLYTAAIARFKTMAASDDPHLLAFVTRLAKWLEDHGPNVTMVFRREVSPALAQADKLLASSPQNRAFGPRQVTKFFDPTSVQPKEADVVTAFDKAMKRVFTPDLIAVKMGPPVDDAAQAALVAKDPLVAVRYRFGWLGTVYGSIALKRASM